MELSELRTRLKLFLPTVRDSLGEMKAKGVSKDECRKEIERTIMSLKEASEYLTYVRDEIGDPKEAYANPNPYMSIEEVCTYLKGVSKETLRN
jgi:hypothetical protein